MPLVGFNSSAPLLSGATVKGYRELLKRLRQNNEESSTSGALFLQAKARAIDKLQNRRERGALNPKRALNK